jgi:alcohol dehydrogenase class IV
MKNSVLEFFSPKTIITGIDSVNSVVEEIERLGGTKILVVTDPGIIDSGLVAPLLDLIRNENIPVDVFDDVNPDLVVVVPLMWPNILRSLSNMRVRSGII